MFGISLRGSRSLGALGWGFYTVGRKAPQGGTLMRLFRPLREAMAFQAKAGSPVSEASGLLASTQRDQKPAVNDVYPCNGMGVLKCILT